MNFKPAEFISKIPRLIDRDHYERKALTKPQNSTQGSTQLFRRPNASQEILTDEPA